MSKNKVTIPSATLLVVVLAFSITAVSNITAQASAQSPTSSGKMHLDEGIKALQGGDKQGAMMHLNLADKALGSGQ